MGRFSKTWTSTWRDFLLGSGPLLGGGLCVWLLRNNNAGHQVLGAAFGGITFLIFSLALAQLWTPRYTIRSTKLRSVFYTKLHQDIIRFTDSNTAMHDTTLRMVQEAKHVISAAPSDRRLSAEIESMERALAWLQSTNLDEISFREFMDRNATEAVIRDLVAKTNEAIEKINVTTINSSIVEPGCVALVEELKRYGLNISHEFEDINGIEQARTLSSERSIAVSFVPFSTLFLSKNRDDICNKYEYVCPITSENQQILAHRNLDGRFDLDSVAVPERGSGHFQLLSMIATGVIGNQSGQTIDLKNFRDAPPTAAKILYEPVASIALEALPGAEVGGFANSIPYPVDIILVSRRHVFGEDLSCFRQLVIVTMCQLKAELVKHDRHRPRLYGRADIRRAFEVANDHFSKILRK